MKFPSISILRFYFLDLTMFIVPHNLYIYINSQNLEKIQLEFNWIFNFAPYIPFN